MKRKKKKVVWFGDLTVEVKMWKELNPKRSVLVWSLWEAIYSTLLSSHLKEHWILPTLMPISEKEKK